MKTQAKVLVTALWSIVAGVSLAFGQTVIPVTAGTDVLKPAIDGAAAGDIIELITDGGAYLSTDQIVIDKDITIRGLSTLPSKPVLKYVGTSTSAYMFKGTLSSRITFENLEFDGDGVADGAAGKAKYVVRLDNGDPTATMSLFMDNVVAHDFNDKFVKPYGNCGMDSLVVTNSIFYNGASEGIVFYSGTSSDPAVVLKYGEVSNSTFYAIEREAIKGQTYPDAKIRVDRNTFYNLGENDKKAMIYFRNMEDVIVKNSIFAVNHNTDLEKFADFASSVSQFHNNVVFDVTNFTVGAATVTDTLQVDPGFADPANADFSLPAGSILLSYADDGGAVGDPRWAPTEGPYGITIYISGEGTVAKDPDAATYVADTEVTLTANPAANWLFDHWSDNISVFPPENPVATITMTKDVAVSAYFVPALDQFAVDTASIGLGHIEMEQITDFDVPGYFAGDSLVLTAVADTATWEFAYWVDAAGDSVDNTNPVEWIVNSDTTFTAKFRSTLTQYALALTVTGTGEVDVTPLLVPGFTTYDVGTVLTLIADAAIGWQFDGYTGDATGTNDTVQVTLDADKAVTATFSEITHANGVLDVDGAWDILDAVEYAHNNSQVDTLKLTSVGPYTPSEDQRSTTNGRMPYIEINSPVAIVGDPTLGSAPVIKGYTSSTSSTSSEGFFRFRSGAGKLYLKNLIIDGFLDEATDAKSAKYIFRADDGSDTVFCSIDVDGVEFMNTVEAFWKSYGLAYIDTMRFVNSTVSNIGKEMIFLNSVGQAKYVELSNSTFRHVGRQIIYLKNMAPTIVVDHVTIDSSGFGYGTEGAKFAAFRIENCDDVTISNTIVSNVPSTDSDSPYVVRISGASSNIDNVLFYNAPDKVDLRDDASRGDDLFWYTPDFAYATEHDYTLKDSSVAYHLAGDGSAAIGDLKWATSTAIAVYNGIDLTMVGNGDVAGDPMPMAKFFIPGTVVTLTADPDTLWKFGGWSGDVTSTELITTVTMDSDKAITVTFEEAWFDITLNVNMKYWADQGKFSIANDYVDVAGSFNEFGGIEAKMDDADGDTIYTASFKIDELIPAIEWKFRINGSTDDATIEFTASGPNRTFTVTQDTSLTFWYSDEEPTVGLNGEYLPVRYSLSQNYPNPFNPETTIEFALALGGKTSLVVYDISGREVARLLDGDMPAGYHSIVLHQPQMASGIYIYRLISGDFVQTRKMIMLK